MSDKAGEILFWFVISPMAIIAGIVAWGVLFRMIHSLITKGSLYDKT